MPGARHCPASQRSPSCDENQAAMAHVGCGVLWIQVCEKWFPESGLKLRCRPWLVRLLSNDSPRRLISRELQGQTGRLDGCMAAGRNMRMSFGCLRRLLDGFLQQLGFNSNNLTAPKANPEPFM